MARSWFQDRPGILRTTTAFEPQSELTMSSLAGATYIEMVIATSAFRLGMEGRRFALENIGFQNPLVLRPSNDDKAGTR